jgi:hypothetical protein
MDSYFEVIDGVGYWFDTDGNAVASQAPGESVVFLQDQTGTLSSATLQAGLDATNWPQLLQAVGGAISAWQLNQINLERARTGKPPINAAAYGPQVGVGLNQQTMNMIIWVAVGLGAVMLFKGRRA